VVVGGICSVMCVFSILLWRYFVCFVDKLANVWCSRPVFASGAVLSVGLRSWRAVGEDARCCSWWFKRFAYVGMLAIVAGGRDRE